MSSGRRWLPQIWEELGKGRVEERELVDKKHPLTPISGLQVGNKVIVSPVHDVVHTLVHELFHRRYPHWPEIYVCSRTTELMRLLSPEEKKQLYDEYRRLRRLRRKLKVT